jgi:hypothetical protein
MAATNTYLERVNSVKMSCEECNNSVKCQILNVYKCNDFTPSISSNFSLEPYEKPDIVEKIFSIEFITAY